MRWCSLLLIRSIFAEITACTFVEPDHLIHVTEWIVFHEVQGITNFILLARYCEDRVMAYLANQLDLITEWFSQQESKTQIKVDLIDFPEDRIRDEDYIYTRLKFECGSYYRNNSRFTIGVPSVNYFVYAIGESNIPVLHLEDGLNLEAEICVHELPTLQLPLFSTEVQPMHFPKFMSQDPASGYIDQYFDPRDSPAFRHLESFGFPTSILKYPKNKSEVQNMCQSIQTWPNSDDIARPTAEPRTLDWKSMPLVPPAVEDTDLLIAFCDNLGKRLTNTTLDHELLDALDTQFASLWFHFYPFRLSRTQIDTPIDTNKMVSALWANRKCSAHGFHGGHTPDTLTVATSFQFRVLEIIDGYQTGAKSVQLNSLLAKVALRIKQFLPRHRFMRLQYPRPMLPIPNNINAICDAGDIWSERKQPCPVEYPYVGQGMHRIPPSNSLYVYGWCKRRKKNTHNELEPSIDEMHRQSRRMDTIDISDPIICPGWPEVACCDYVPDTGVSSHYDKRVDLEHPNPWGGFAPCFGCQLPDDLRKKLNMNKT